LAVIKKENCLEGVKQTAGKTLFKILLAVVKERITGPKLNVCGVVLNNLPKTM